MGYNKIYHIGDRVRVIDRVDGWELAGYKGTIVDVPEIAIGVDFDDHIGGHSCHNHARSGHGRYSHNPDRELEIISNARNLSELERSEELEDFLSKWAVK